MHVAGSKLFSDFFFKSHFFCKAYWCWGGREGPHDLLSSDWSDLFTICNFEESNLFFCFWPGFFTLLNDIYKIDKYWRKFTRLSHILLKNRVNLTKKLVLLRNNFNRLTILFSSTFLQGQIKITTKKLARIDNWLEKLHFPE